MRGPQAIDLVEHVTSNYASRLHDGQAQYSALLYPHGGFVDDIVLHRMAGDHYLLCVNAANQEKDYQWIISQNRYEAEVEFASDRYAQLAIQGPKAQAALAKLTDTDLSSIAYYCFAHGEVAGEPAIIAPDRLHRRRWIRDIHRTGCKRSHVERHPRSRERIRHPPLRPWRTQHAPPRSGDVALRP